MTRWSRWVLAHKRLVMGFWLVALLAGGVASTKVGGKLSQEFALPGQPGHQANAAILDTYGNGGLQQALVAVVRPPAGQTVTSPSARQVLARASARRRRRRSAPCCPAAGASGSPAWTNWNSVATRRAPEC